ncbi:hypothetical protein LTR86_010597 [Recurvomyces mirabilis]|nr:hypothetical protein LTR86_010597 [Recurvomyces mirabilis]
MDIVNCTIADMRTHTCLVSDMRSTREEYTLDTHGFMILHQASALLPPQRSAKQSFSFDDTQQLTEQYFPDLRALLRDNCNARSIVPFNAVVRQSSTSAHVGPGSNKPFFVVHCDYSPAGIQEVLRNVAPTFFADLGLNDITSEAERDIFFALRDEIISQEKQNIRQSGATSHLDWDGSNYKGPRWSVYSVWRSLEKVRSDPLAVLDPRTAFVRPDFDLGHYNNNSHAHENGRSYQQLRLPHKNRTGFQADYENQNIMPLHPDTPGYKEQLQDESKRHRWLFLDEQEPEEVLVLKLFDSQAWQKSRRGVVMPGAAHSAFALPDQDSDKPRRSVEVRFIIFY